MSDMTLALVAFVVCLSIAWAAAVSAVALVQSGTLRITREKLQKSERKHRKATRERARLARENVELRERLDASEAARLRDPDVEMTPYDVFGEGL